MITAIRKIRTLLTQAERKKAGFLLLLTIIGMLLETLSVGLVVPLVGVMVQSNIIDQYPAIKPVLEYFNYPSQTEMIIGAMAFFVLLYFIKGAFLAFCIWTQTKFAYNLQQRVSEQLFSSYLSQPYIYHLNRNSATLIRNATSEVALFTIVISALLLIITEVLVMLGVASILIYIEPVGAIVVVSVLATAGLLFIKFTKKKVTFWGQARQHHDGLRLQHLQQGLGGVKEVKLYGREADFLKQFSVHNFQSARTNGFQVILQQLPRLGLEFLAILGLAMLVFIMAFKGSSLAVIVPTLGLFAAAAFRLMPSANRLLNALQNLRFYLPVLNVLDKELSTNVVEPSPSAITVSDSDHFKNNIQLDNVSFSYDGANTAALSDVSLTINKGETVGLIGPSGSGKSTLVDILLGMFDPSKGDLLVDGQPISNNKRSWQNQIGYVPQSIYLTDATLKSNVAFGLPEDKVNDEAVLAAIKAAQLTNFVDSLPDGIDTIVGERGVRLSGGQRQRIGIARALYHDPEVLVFDEATSALDTETEHYVMQAIYGLHDTKTIIIVAHRLSTVERCDKLFQLESGKIIASGLPQDLLS